jgi:hypothetical protein
MMSGDYVVLIRWASDGSSSSRHQWRVEAVSKHTIDSRLSNIFLLLPKFRHACAAMCAMK